MPDDRKLRRIVASGRPVSAEARADAAQPREMLELPTSAM
jgi:hypothetical protein